MFLFLVSLENEAPVGAAESEAVGERIVDAHGARTVGNIIEIAQRIRVVEVDGRGSDLIANGQHSDARLEATGAPQQVTGHGLRGTDGQLGSMGAKGALECLGLDTVADIGGSAVRVDVLYLAGLETGIA